MPLISINTDISLVRASFHIQCTVVSSEAPICGRVSLMFPLHDHLSPHTAPSLVTETSSVQRYNGTATNTKAATPGFKLTSHTLHNHSNCSDSSPGCRWLVHNKLLHLTELQTYGRVSDVSSTDHLHMHCFFSRLPIVQVAPAAAVGGSPSSFMWENYVRKPGNGEFLYTIV